MKNNTKQYISPREADVIARLAYEKLSIVTRQQFDNYFNFPQRVREKILYRLNKRKILKKIKKGVYFYSPLETGPAGSNISEFLIPPIFFPKGNYYIGYSTMYNYYGFTEQLFQVMYILNTSLQKEKTISNIQFKMVKISPKRMFGLQKIKIKDAEVIISDRERTLVDLIYFPEPVGGLNKAFEILQEQVKSGKIDIKKFIGYALKFPSLSTLKRIGFSLEQSGIPDRQLSPLFKRAKKTSLINLYPAESRKGKVNKKWMIIESVT